MISFPGTPPAACSTAIFTCIEERITFWESSAGRYIDRLHFKNCKISCLHHKARTGSQRVRWSLQIASFQVPRPAVPEGQKKTVIGGERKCIAIKNPGPSRGAEHLLPWSANVISTARTSFSSSAFQCRWTVRGCRYCRRRSVWCCMVSLNSFYWYTSG
jgi:hypothetical protein